MDIRQPAVAGTFYPASPDALGASVAALMARAPAPEVALPKALVMPHAGYRYSGAPAAAAAAAIPEDTQVARVVVLGPSHHYPVRGVAIPSVPAFATPLGEIPLDAEALARLAREPDVAVDDRAHAPEHAIEVELPFLQARLGSFALVPMIVGAIAPARLAEILALVWGGDETLIVISTDLSHFLTAEAAEARDRATAEKAELLSTGIDPEEACGARPLAGFLAAAAARGMRLTRLALTHSGRVTGDRRRVVGYGAWLAQAPDAAEFPPAARRAALRLAAQSLRSRVHRGTTPEVALGSFAPPLQGMGASFVTLTTGGDLRGCVGSLAANRPLAEDISTNAVRAGFSDPRFPAIGAAELGGLTIEIALLGPPAPLDFASEAELLAQLRPGRDGLILEDGARRGTFLPKVWESLPEPAGFLAALKQKAGLARDHWSRSLRVRRYSTESFSAPLAAALG